jgi:glycosyltransferase involved in cell wall biosynthesis
MIPTCDRTRYLAQTLNSVLAAGIGPQEMQIEVVDDCSTQNDPEPIIKAVCPERITFYRQSHRVGMAVNWNTCIERARGQLVHILNDDDYVEPTFYSQFESAFEQSPNCAAIFSRVFFVDEEDELVGISEYVSSLRRESNDASQLMMGNPLRTPAVVVKRCFYERHGGFNSTLVYVLDWEMWVRAIRYGRARMLNKPLACYRIHSGNSTTNLSRSAENLQDYLRLGMLWKAQNLADFDHASFMRMVAWMGYYQSEQYSAVGDKAAARENLNFWRNFCPPSEQWWFWVRSWAKSVVSWLEKRWFSTQY